MAKRTKKERIPMGVRQEFEDVDYWSKLIKSKETVRLPDGSVIPVYNYMKKFMQESYGNGFSRKDPKKNILQTEEQKKWARRNNNNTNRDALNVARKSDRLTNSEFLLEKGHFDELEAWEHDIKVQGYEAALDKLLDISTKELGCHQTQATKRSLLRFYFRIKKFLRYVRKDKQNARV